MLQNLNFVKVLVAVRLLKAPIFMFEQAPIAIGAEKLFRELFAYFRFVLLILWFFKEELVITMRELAFDPVTTLALLNPVLAHLGLKLSPVDFHGLALVALLLELEVVLVGDKGIHTDGGLIIQRVQMLFKISLIRAV